MRRLLLSVDVLRMVAGFKHKIEALAFAVLIKQHRINSLISNATQRKLKKEFGIGAERLRRIVSNGLSLGFLRKEGDNLIANRLHDNRGLVLTLMERFFDDALLKSKKGILTLNGVIRIVEAAILYNQVSIQVSCEDTHCSANSESLPLGKVKKARKKEASMLHSGEYDNRYRGLRNVRIQQLIGRKKSSAINAVKHAIGLGMLNKRWNIRFFNSDKDQCEYMSRQDLNKEDMRMIVCLKKNYIGVRFANVYSKKTELMKLANNR